MGLDLTGPERTYGDDRFVVHYTVEGDDAPTGGDADDDGIPDAVPRVLHALHHGEEQYRAEGWRMPLADGGAEGSDAIDVWLRVVDGNGWSTPIAVHQEPARSCYVQIDSRLGGQGPEVLESVAVHELHHCVQFAYTARSDAWIYEATSTFEQYRVYENEALQLALGVLWGTRLSAPETPIDATGDRREYAMFAWTAFWEQWDGRDFDRLPALWEALAQEPDSLVALDGEAERSWGVSLDDAYLGWAEWMGFACSRDDGRHWNDELACTLDVEAEYQDATSFTFAPGDGPYASGYARAAADGDERPYQVTCTAPGDGQRVGVEVVALDADGVGGETATGWADGGETIDVALSGAVDPDGSVMVALASTGEQPANVDCELTRAELPEEPKACGCDSGRTGGAWTGVLAVLGVVARRRSRRRR